MKNYTEQELKEKYQRLPEEIKEAMFSDDLGKAMKDLAVKYGIDIDTIEEIESSARMVMFGLIHLDDFAAFLSRDLKIDIGVASKMTHEIAREVFAKISGPLSVVSAAEKYKRPEMAPHFNALPGKMLIQ